jgi:K+-transporting ATPase ATPase C chain
MSEDKVKDRAALGGTVVRLAILSMLVCGLLFPLVITGIAQALFPYQANGELVQLDGRTVGSNFIDNNFTSPIFFHARPSNDSASGIDPDITLEEAYSQIPRISNATGISESALHSLVDENEEGVYLGIFGSPYVNVLKLNLALINAYPSTYNSSSVKGLGG